jgi:hypothetical protein
MNEDTSTSLAMTSPEIALIATALAAAQGELTNPKMDSEATVRSKKGDASSYGYKYASLAQILTDSRPILAKNGIAIVQAQRPGMLTTMLVHTSGQWFASHWFLPSGISPQDLGSWITYGRRYSLVPLLGIAADHDDDGQQAQDGGAKVEPGRLDKMRGELVELMSNSTVSNKSLGDYCRAAGIGDFRVLNDYPLEVLDTLAASWKEVVAKIRVASMPRAESTPPAKTATDQPPRQEGTTFAKPTGIDFKAKLAEEQAAKAKADAEKKSAVEAELSPAEQSKEREARAEPPPRTADVSKIVPPGDRVPAPTDAKLLEAMALAGISPEELFAFYVAAKHQRCTPDKLPAPYLQQLLLPSNWAKVVKQIKNPNS